MPDGDIRDVDTRLLSKLMKLDDASLQWVPEDSSAILEHQLASRIRSELTAYEPAASKIVARFESDANPRPTFLDALTAVKPRVELLVLIKRYAKHLHSGEQIPRNVSRILYLAAVAAALVRCHERITRADDADLKAGLEWGCQQPAVTPELQRLLQQAIASLDA